MEGHAWKISYSIILYICIPLWTTSNNQKRSVLNLTQVVTELLCAVVGSSLRLHGRKSLVCGMTRHGRHSWTPFSPKRASTAGVVSEDMLLAWPGVNRKVLNMQAWRQPRHVLTGSQTDRRQVCQAGMCGGCRYWTCGSHDPWPDSVYWTITQPRAFCLGICGGRRRKEEEEKKNRNRHCHYVMSLPALPTVVCMPTMMAFPSPFMPSHVALTVTDSVCVWWQWKEGWATQPNQQVTENGRKKKRKSRKSEKEEGRHLQWTDRATLWQTLIVVGDPIPARHSVWPLGVFCAVDRDRDREWETLARQGPKLDPIPEEEPVPRWQAVEKLLFNVDCSDDRRKDRRIVNPGRDLACVSPMGLEVLVWGIDSWRLERLCIVNPNLIIRCWWTGISVYSNLTIQKILPKSPSQLCIIN